MQLKSHFPNQLRGHAGEIRHFIPALALVAWKKASESQAFAHMAECCHHLAKFYSIIGEDDFFMKDCKQAERCLKESMVHYIWLHKHFDDGVRFTLTPKCHFLAHIAEMLLDIQARIFHGIYFDLGPQLLAWHQSCATE